MADIHRGQVGIVGVQYEMGAYTTDWAIYNGTYVVASWENTSGWWVARDSGGVPTAALVKPPLDAPNLTYRVRLGFSGRYENYWGDFTYDNSSGVPPAPPGPGPPPCSTG